MTERLGIDESSAQRRTLGVLVITLVYDFIRPYCCFSISDLCKRLVESGHLIVAEAVAYVCRYCPSRLPKPLSEEEETAGLPVVIVTALAGVTLVGLLSYTCCLGSGIEVRELVEVSTAEVELRLEENRCVL